MSFVVVVFVIVVAIAASAACRDENEVNTEGVEGVSEIKALLDRLRNRPENAQEVVSDLKRHYKKHPLAWEKGGMYAVMSFETTEDDAIPFTEFLCFLADEGEAGAVERVQEVVIVRLSDRRSTFGEWKKDQGDVGFEDCFRELGVVSATVSDIGPETFYTK